MEVNVIHMNYESFGVTKNSNLPPLKASPLPQTCAIRTFKLEGAVPAVFTPMTKDGEVDLDKIEDYCKYLVENGISQVFVNGTTGEGFALTLEERTKVVAKWMDVKRRSDGKLKSVVVQVGALNLHDTQAMARHAASVGADAISSVPPLFFKPKTVDYLVQYCKEVASVAPDLPFYLYHVPIMTDVQVNVEDFLREGMKQIPSLVGAKFSSPDLVDLIGCANLEAPHREERRLNFAFGCDAQLMSGIITGSDGGVGSTYNMMPRLIVRLIKNTTEGNIAEARRDQLRVQQFARSRAKYDKFVGTNVASSKAIMGMIGLDLGPSRSPYCGPTEEVRKNLRKDLESIGFFDWRN